MLGSHLSVIINIGGGFGTMEHFSLTHGKQLITVSALVQIVPFLLKEQLQFLHEQSTHKLVFSLFQNI